MACGCNNNCNTISCGENTDVKDAYRAGFKAGYQAGYNDGVNASNNGNSCGCGCSRCGTRA